MIKDDILLGNITNCAKNEFQLLEKKNPSLYQFNVDMTFFLRKSLEQEKILKG